MLATVKEVILALVDIFLVSFFLYEFFMMLRGTRAAQVIKGIAVLALLSFLANLINLRASSWMLGKFWTWGVIAFIILFQSELKQALSRIGQRWTVFGGGGELRECISEVVKAAERMSKAGIGGLIVFERDDPLDYFITSGIRMDSSVTWQLLMTIFSPESPMRDGAVIIRNGRIAASSAILPIPRELIDEEMEFGYRHRAAIGVTKGTDAISVVISEERGTISVAVGGRLQSDLSPLSLEKALTDHLLARKERGGKR
ncbi:TIGR00159 family protein [Candidatus Poribacteria bacterium]|nr:MAG: TIGR00159 family protein [Candidatus Poribacteria bacterium]